jgi:hypothetical protein
VCGLKLLKLLVYEALSLHAYNAARDKVRALKLLKFETLTY